MLQSLEIFRLADGLARHASARQALVTANIAHADSPGYRARDISPFSDTLGVTAPLQVRRPRPAHAAGADAGPGEARFRARVDPGATAGPNGNSVSLEAEMVKAAELRQDYDMALSVYQSALGILRGALGRGR